MEPKMEPCALYKVYDFCVKTWPDRYTEPAEEIVGFHEEDDHTYLKAPWMYNHYFLCEGDWITALNQLHYGEDNSK